jgi:biopolymer transport protein ExbD
MAMGGGGGNKGVKSEINVTPLVDVVLVLLIIFMVVTPMLQRGKDVRLPQARSIDEEDKQADPLVLSLTSDKRIYVESDAYDEEGFKDRIRREMEAQPFRKVLLKGDDSLTFGDVRKVMELTRLAGAKGVALGVEEVKK